MSNYPAGCTATDIDDLCETNQEMDDRLSEERMDAEPVYDCGCCGSQDCPQDCPEEFCSTRCERVQGAIGVIERHLDGVDLTPRQAEAIRYALGTIRLSQRYR